MRCSPALVLFAVLAIAAQVRGHEEEEEAPLATPQAAPACPCSNPDWCNAITTRHPKEVFIFVVDPEHYPHYAWSTPITTAAVTTNAWSSGLMCHAHQHDARAVYLADFPTDQLTNATARTEWIAMWLETVQTTFADGINLDFEDPLAVDDPARAGLTLLVQELSTTFHTALPHSQITVDVAWSPDCIDGRCFDYPAIAQAADFLFVMGYDEQSQIFPPRRCEAYANDPIEFMHSALDGWLHRFGVPAQQLVWGVPWYGYNYVCVNDTGNPRDCPITPVPFRNASCSDAAGTQHDYSELMWWLAINATHPHHAEWDAKAAAPWFVWYDNTGTKNQVWYDDPRSLTIRYETAKARGLLGVGMWEADSLDYTGTEPGKTQTREMWDALKRFF